MYLQHVIDVCPVNVYGPVIGYQSSPIRTVRPPQTPPLVYRLLPICIPVYPPEDRTWNTVDVYAYLLPVLTTTQGSYYSSHLPTGPTAAS